jgi:tRNA A-37 threonylcarbamoyl transferase component Bud32
MFSFIKNFYHPSSLLTDAEFQLMCADATVLEQDVRGVKVLLLNNRKILKIFRLRGGFSSSRIYSDALSFCRNAERLKKLGISTIGSYRLYHLSNSKNAVVIYDPLVGDTLRTLLIKNKITENDCRSLGAFVARLHTLGIYFKSLHLGNIVLSISGQLGLIDFADVRIFPWRLMLKTRVRSFKRLLRYHEDVKILGKKNCELILASYIKSSGLNAYQSDSLRSQIKNIYSNVIDSHNKESND